MSFESRLQKFAEITSRFPCEKPCPFIAAHPLNKDLFQALRLAVAIFLSRSMRLKSPILDDELLMREFCNQQKKGEIFNCTPNGLIVPKRPLNLEYNAVVRAYIDILEDMCVTDFIVTLNSPSIRYKEGLADFDARKLGRNYPSEKPHLDSWTGDGPNGLTVSVPLYGDAERNRVEWFAPPKTLREEWLDYKPSYDDGEWIVKQYGEKIDLPYTKGHVYFLDASVLHHSVRYAGAGPRFALDNIFAITPPSPAFKGRIGRPFKEMQGIGQTTFLAFQDDLTQFKENTANQLPLEPKIVTLF